MSTAISAAMSTASGSETDRSERSAHTVTAEALATATAAARHRWDDWVCQVCGNRNRGFRERCNLNVCRAPCAFPGPYSPAVSATGPKNAPPQAQAQAQPRQPVVAQRPPSPVPMAVPQGMTQAVPAPYMQVPQPMYYMPQHAVHGAPQMAQQMVPALVPQMVPQMVPQQMVGQPGMVLMMQ